MIIGFIVVAILSGLPNNIAGIFGAQVVYSAELAAGNGISVVDLLRHHRHVFRGDFVSNGRRKFESGAHGVTRPTKECMVTGRAGSPLHARGLKAEI